MDFNAVHSVHWDVNPTKIYFLLLHHKMMVSKLMVRRSSKYFLEKPLLESVSASCEDWWLAETQSCVC